MSTLVIPITLLLLVLSIHSLPLDDSEVAAHKEQKAELSKNCPKNTEFLECTNLCPKSCQDFDQLSACFSLRCGNPGCTCKDGTIRLDPNDASKGCVTREVCRELRNQGKLN